MKASTANLIAFLVFVLIMLFMFIKISLMSDDELNKKAQEIKEETSNKIKEGIRKSKIYGTKKSRKKIGLIFSTH